MLQARFWNLNSLLIGLFALLFSSQSLAKQGCVIFWEGQQARLEMVNLPEIKGPGLANARLQIDASEMQKQLDPAGPLCFTQDDERLLQVHVFYWAHKQISFYNEILRSIGHPPLPLITLKLIPISKNSQADDDSGFAQTSKMRVVLFYSRPVFDSTLLWHELGHLIQEHLRPRPQGTKENSEAQAIAEAFGDLMVAFFSGETVMFSRSKQCEPARDILELIRFPQDARTIEQELRSLIAQPHYEARCPRSFATANQILKGEFQIPLHEYQPHHLSRVISRPIWISSLRSPKIREIFFKAIAGQDADSFQSLLTSLFREAGDSSSELQILKQEFRSVGLLN